MKNRFGRPFLGMPYTQFVEAGRLALICFGPLADKLAVIVDILDDKRVIIDILESNEPRQMIPIKRLKLTDFVAEIPRNAPEADVKKAVEAADLIKKWNDSKWAQNIKKGQNRSNMNDFQRFKYSRLVAKRDELVAKQLKKH